MGIDLEMSAWLSAFRIEYMRLTGKAVDEAAQAAFDWVGANADWRSVIPEQAAVLAQPHSLYARLG